MIHIAHQFFLIYGIIPLAIIYELELRFYKLIGYTHNGKYLNRISKLPFL